MDFSPRMFGPGHVYSRHYRAGKLRTGAGPVLLLVSISCLMSATLGVGHQKCESVDPGPDTGCKSALRSECDLPSNSNFCSHSLANDKQNGNLAPATWTQAHLVLRLKPVKASEDAAPSCIAMRFELGLGQMGVAALHSSSAERAGQSEFEPGAKEEYGNAGVVEAGQAAERPESVNSGGSSTSVLPRMLRILSAKVKHDGHYLTASYPDQETHSPVISVTGTYNTTADASKPIKVNLCIAYQQYQPSSGGNSMAGEQEANVKSEVSTQPPVLAVIRHLDIRCSKCAKSEPPPSTPASKVDPSSAATMATSTSLKLLTPLARTSSSQPEASTFPSSTGPKATSTVTRPRVTSTPSFIPTEDPQSTQASSTSKRQVMSTVDESIASMSVSSSNAEASEKRHDDSDFMLFLTGNRLYVTAGVLALLAVLIVVIIVLIAMRRRRQDGRYMDSPSKRETLSSDIPSAFSTLVSSTNTASTRMSAPGVTATKPKHDHPQDLDLGPAEMASTFPRVSVLGSPVESEKADYATPYHSSNVCSSSKQHTRSFSDQNVYQTPEEGSDDTSDVLFYTMASKPPVSRTGYSALSSDTLERSNPYTNNYNAPSKQSKRTESSKRGFRSKKSQSLDVVPGATSSLPRNSKMGRTASDGHESDQSDVSDTFPQLPPSQRGSLKTAEEGTGSQTEGWPDFTVFPSLGSDYAKLNIDMPVPARSGKRPSQSST